MEKFELNRELITKLLATVDVGLSSGLGTRRPGRMCVEAAVCYAMGLPHGDNPTCVDSAIRSMKIRLNDSSWSSKTARAKGMRRLAVLQLGTKDSGFDRHEFAKKLALMTIKTILPIALTAVGLQNHAAKCQAVITLEEGLAAARAAARAADATIAVYAANAAYVARAAARAANAAARAARAAARAANAACDAANAVYAADAVDAAAYAPDAAARAAGAANAAKRDEILSAFAKGAEDILIEMNVPAVRYLDML